MLDLNPGPQTATVDETVYTSDAPSNLSQSFLKSAARHEHSVAFLWQDQIVVYADLSEAVTHTALRLTSQPGWRPRTPVGIHLPNTPAYAAAFYGVLLAGGIAIPLPVEQTSEWKRSVIDVTQSPWIFEAGEDSEWLPTLTSTGRQTASREQTSVPESLAAVFFTSGSSGTPKGVMLSHRNLLSNVESICASLPLQATDRALCVLPFCHAYGNSVLQTHLLRGAALVLGESATFPPHLVDCMERHAVTSFAGVPDFYRLLMPTVESRRGVLSRLRYATVAGGALRPALIREYARVLAPAEFYVMYGQTEATARLSCLPAKELNSRCGSIGRGIPGVTLRIRDDQGRDVSPGQIGEIHAAGPNMMLGYWKDTNATAQVLRDGWLRTGDLATVDEQGYIYPQGRISQLLKIGGYRMHPAEVEAVVSREFPMIEPILVPFETEAGVLRLALFVLPLRPGLVPDVPALRACCHRLLARHQRPELIIPLESPPRTPSLKIDRVRLSRMALESVRAHAMQTH